MRVALILLCIALFSCQNPPELSQSDKIAQAFCECTTPLIELNRQAATLVNDTLREAEFKAKLAAIQVENDKSKDCSRTIVARFGKIKAADMAAVEKSLIVQCPALAQQHDLLRELLGE